MTGAVREKVLFPDPEKLSGKTEELAICFVCTGNTCRSPMAEAYMKSRGFENAFSRGLAAHNGAPISENSARALADAGVDERWYASFRSANMTDADMARADVIYCMTSAHAARLFFDYPQYAGKIHVMPKEISDPYGGDIETYKKTFAEIVSAIAELFPTL